jgi:predicted transcriptional regulator
MKSGLTFREFAIETRIPPSTLSEYIHNTEPIQPLLTNLFKLMNFGKRIGYNVSKLDAFLPPLLQKEPGPNVVDNPARRTMARTLRMLRLTPEEYARQVKWPRSKVYTRLHGVMPITGPVAPPLPAGPDHRISNVR